MTYSSPLLLQFEGFHHPQCFYSLQTNTKTNVNVDQLNHFSLGEQTTFDQRRRGTTVLFGGDSLARLSLRRDSFLANISSILFAPFIPIPLSVIHSFHSDDMKGRCMVHASCQIRAFSTTKRQDKICKHECKIEWENIPSRVISINEVFFSNPSKIPMVPSSPISPSAVPTHKQPMSGHHN